jgi:hypothetical protein
MKYLFSLFFVAFMFLQTYAQSKFSLSYIYSFNPVSNGHTTGINVRYNFNEKLSLTSGLQYSVKSSSKKTYDIVDSNNTSLGTSITYSSLKVIEIPLLLSYETNRSSKVSLYVSGGLVPGYIVSEKQTTAILNHSSNKSSKIYNIDSRRDLDDKYKKIMLSGYIGIGGMVKLSEKFSLLFQPNFKYELTNFVKPMQSDEVDPQFGHGNADSPKYHPYSIGLLCGVYYQFK